MSAAFFVFGLLPFPSTFSWLIQTVWGRENSNAIRVLSGFLFGISIGIALGYLLLLDISIITIIVPLYASYVVVVMLIMRAANVIPNYLLPYEKFLHEATK